MADPKAMTELLTTAPCIGARSRHKTLPAGREIRRAQQRQQEAKNKPQQTQRKGFA